jgi:hypothetical protein
VQGRPGLVGRAELGDQRLRDAVAEAERLRAGERWGIQALHLGQAGRPQGGGRGVPLGQGIESRLVLGVQQQQRVDRVGRAAPAPPLGGALPDVAEDAAPVVGGHPARELIREPGQGALEEAQASQPGRGERDMHGLRPVAALGRGHLVGQDAKPGPSRRRVVDARQHEAGGPQRAVAAGDQALDVVQL